MSERAGFLVIGGGVIGASARDRLARAATSVERSFPVVGPTGTSSSVGVTARTTW